MSTPAEATQIKGKATFIQQATQVLLPTLTAIGFLLTSLKKPQYGLLVNFVSQFFWFYASWKAWKEAKQIGVFITTVIIFLIVSFGVINYWIL